MRRFCRSFPMSLDDLCPLCPEGYEGYRIRPGYLPAPHGSDVNIEGKDVDMRCEVGTGNGVKDSGHGSDVSIGLDRDRGVPLGAQARLRLMDGERQEGIYGDIELQASLAKLMLT